MTDPVHLAWQAAALLLLLLMQEGNEAKTMRRADKKGSLKVPMVILAINGQVTLSSMLTIAIA